MTDEQMQPSTEENVIDPTTPLEELTLKQLQSIADELGVPDADTFITKKQVITVINAMKLAKAAGSKKPVEYVKDDKLEDDKFHETKISIIQKKLAAQPKVQVFLFKQPKEPVGRVIDKMVNGKRILEKSGAVQEVIINGYVTYVPKGVSVEVPEQIAKLLGQSITDTQMAGEQYKVERPSNDPMSPEFKTVQEALS